MRKWQDLAPPDDPGSWYAVSNAWPTKRGTYETSDLSTGTSKTATGGSFVHYAFCAKTLSSTLEYVFDAAKLWQYSAGSLTDRTNGVSIGTYPMCAQYGNVTIAVMGVGTATVSASGGNFSALAGAPQGEIVLVSNNAVLVFNTNTSTDGWAASDVGDYTNWTTGEAASGRIIETPGPILAGVVYGAHAYAFKADAIYRFTYVGGQIKWQIELAWRGNGMSYVDTAVKTKYQIVSTIHGIAFNGSATTDNAIYLFDGASPPRLLNPLTSLGSSVGVLVYNPIEDVLCIAPAEGSNVSGQVLIAAATFSDSFYYYYNFASDSWGKGCGSAAEDRESATTFPTSISNGVLQGDYFARAESSSKPVFWRYRSVTGNAHYRCAPSAPATSCACYLQTALVGRSDRKTLWTRLTPQLRRRTDLGTDSAALSVTLYREREDTSVVSTTSVAESTQRKRFHFSLADSFARFKVTWTDLDVEVDDFLIISKDAGAE